MVDRIFCKSSSLFANTAIFYIRYNTLNLRSNSIIPTTFNFNSIIYLTMAETILIHNSKLQIFFFCERIGKFLTLASTIIINKIVNLSP